MILKKFEDTVLVILTDLIVTEFEIREKNWVTHWLQKYAYLHKNFINSESWFDTSYVSRKWQFFLSLQNI